MENRQNFERLKLHKNWAGEPSGVESRFRPPSPTLATGESAASSLALSVLLGEVLLPILERVNQSLDELERFVTQIAEAPHG